MHHIMRAISEVAEPRRENRITWTTMKGYFSPLNVTKISAKYSPILVFAIRYTL